MTTPDLLKTLAKLPPRCFAMAPGRRWPLTAQIDRGVPGCSIIDTLRTPEA